MRQGEEGGKLRVVANGQAEVVVAADGRDRRVNLLDAGELFGLAARRRALEEVTRVAPTA